MYVVYVVSTGLVETLVPNIAQVPTEEKYSYIEVEEIPQPEYKVGKSAIFKVLNGALVMEYVDRSLTQEEKSEKTLQENEQMKKDNEQLNLQIIDLWETLINGGVI